MSKNLFILSLTTLLAFTACEKKEEAKKDGVTVEAAKDVKAPAAMPAPTPAPATMPAPSTTTTDTATTTAPAQDASTPPK